MKKLGLLISLVLIFATVRSQDTVFYRRFIVGTFSEVGQNQPIRLTRKYVTEDVGPFHGYESLSMGFKFSGMITQKLRLEIAAGYSVHKCGFELSPPIYPESKIYPVTIKTVVVPVSVYRYLRWDFFINLGTVVDFEVPRKSYWIDSQNGFGFSLGVGKEFAFKYFEFDISPNIEVHSVMPFHSVKNQQQLFVYGIKVGMGPCLRKREKETIKLETTRY